MTTGSPQPSLSIALLSTSTLQFLAVELKRELKAWGWQPTIWQSGFNQYRQAIADPDSALYEARPEAVILHLDGEDLFADVLKDPFSYSDAALAEQVKAAANELEHWVLELQRNLPASLLVLSTISLPPVHALTGLEYHSAWNVTGLAFQFNAELGRIARAHANILVHDVAALVSDMGYRNWFDPRLWYLARSRLSSKACKACARSLCALLRAWKGRSKKCIALDLDGTLWGGIVGEDGPAGILVGEEGLGLAYADFQGELLNLSRKGVLLAICSKNNEADALEAIRTNLSMRLRENDFAALSVNWNDKATNLKELAAALNIGLDSFVFIDDNPVERSLVRATLPEVYVPEWPQDPSDYKAALLDLASEQFPRATLSHEDRKRTSLYRAQADRQALAAASESLEEYYRSLEMRAALGPADPTLFPRIAQLTQKTNQFNLTSRRYTESEIAGLASSPAALVSWLRVRDRFSDEGIVGVLIARQLNPASAWVIDTLLLSCRVIGRHLERALVACACTILRERGARVIIGEFAPTKKNAIASRVYPDLGFTLLSESETLTRWQFPLDEQEIAVPDWISLEMHHELSNA